MRLAKHDDQVSAASLAIAKLTFLPRVIPGFCSENIAEFQQPAGESFAGIALLKDMRLQGLCFTWNNAERKLYVYDEMTSMEKMFNLPSEIYGNEKMFLEGDNTYAYLKKRGLYIRNTYNYDEYGAILTLNWLVKERRILINPNCRELNRTLKSWILKNNMPDKDGIGIVEAVLVIISVLKEKGKSIEKPMEKLPYGMRSKEHTRPDFMQPVAKKADKLKRHGWLI